VVMPARNAEATVKRSVISTLRALGPADELIVGLHNSEDSTDHVLSTISDPRLKVRILTKMSFSEALNSLAQQSGGDYLARMDADDICLPWRFRVQAKQLDGRDGVFLFSSVIVIGATRPRWLPIPQHPLWLNDRVSRKLLEQINPLNHPTLFTRRSTFEALGGYRNLAGEDLDLWLRAALDGVRLIRADLPTVVYRVSQTQLSKEPWYEEGWRTGEEIQTLRTALVKQNSESKVVLTFPERLTVSAIRVGFPTPRNLRARSQIRKASGRGGSFDEE